MVQRSSKYSLIGGAIAAVAASLCCIGPLVLVTVGIGGAWVASLAALEPYRPIFLGIAILSLFFAYRKIYRMPAAESCVPGSLCAMSQTNRLYKVLFWGVAALILIALTSSYFAPLFY